MVLHRAGQLAPEITKAAENTSRRAIRHHDRLAPGQRLFRSFQRCFVAPRQREVVVGMAHPHVRLETEAASQPAGALGHVDQLALKARTLGR